MSKEEVRTGNNEFGVASLILGLLSLILFFTIVPSIILGILGIIFGLIQKKRHNTKWALAGIILSILGIILSVGIAWFIIATFKEVTRLVQSCMQDPTLPGCEDILQYLNQQGVVNQYG
ncbi:MAG: hypothetical protein Q7S27_07140 [Nanoarchaeota archaeon]|nr:hypothetical protein [Nanoarchaeota archaeon]